MKFERGRDPGEVMDVGWKMTIPELEEKYHELRKELESKRNLSIPTYLKATEEVWTSRPQRFVTECGWANINVIFYKVEKEEYSKLYHVIVKWHKKLVE